MNVVYFSQEDDRWKNTLYSITGDRTQTIGTSACGPTCMAMVLSTLTGNTVLPTTTSSYAVKKGFRTANSGTGWDFFKTIAKDYGIDCVQTGNLADAKKALYEGKLVIASMGKGHFTGGGHYILLVGIRNKNGIEWIDVFDPNHDNRKYGADGLIDQGVRDDGKVTARESVFAREAKQYWILSKTAQVSQGGSGSTMRRKISNAGVRLIQNFEGCRLTAYKPVPTERYWTIGWGHYGPDVKQGMTITQAQADSMLVSDLAKYEAYVNNPSYVPVTAQLNQHQFDALVSFCYNCGAGNLRTLCKDRTIAQIASSILKYDKAGGKVLAGLVKRRKAELELFNKPVDQAKPGNIETEENEMTAEEKKVFNEMKEQINQLTLQVEQLTKKSSMDVPAYAEEAVTKLTKLKDKNGKAVLDTPNGRSADFYSNATMLDRLGLLDK